MSYDDYDDDEGFGIFWPLTFFIALGIWIVIQRYQSVRNRAVPFYVRPPEVSVYRMRSWISL